MDIFNLTFGKKLKTPMIDESMSIVLNNGMSIKAFNFSVSERNVETSMSATASFALFTDKYSVQD